MTKLQKINKFIDDISIKELKTILKGLLTKTLTVDDVLENVDYE